MDTINLELISFILCTKMKGVNLKFDWTLNDSHFSKIVTKGKCTKGFEYAAKHSV